MATQVTKVGNGTISVERDGTLLTGITTGIPPNSFAIRKLASKRHNNGWVVRGDQINDWRVTGLIEHGGLIYAIGPQCPGTFVEDALRDTNRDRTSDLVTIASAFAALSRANIPIGQVHTRCMLLLDGGGALVLPPDISESVREHQDLAGRLRTVEPFRHPDESPTENVGFFLAAITYFVLTGRYPFEGDTSEDLHGRIRGGTPIEAIHRRYDLRSEVSDLLSKALSGESYEASPLAWAERLESWSRDGYYVPLADQEREEIRIQAEAAIRRIERSFSRRELARRNGRKWLAAATIAVAVSAILGTIVYNAAQPRVTAGFSPDQVVTTFYTSINTLDHMTMEETVVDRAGRSLIREVTTLFVIDRQRMSLDYQSGFVDAQIWRSGGMPPLEIGSLPYGVVNLSLEPVTAPDGEIAFRATYERWLPDPQETPDQEFVQTPYAGYRMTDEVRLRQDREDWVIYDLVSLAIEDLDLNDLRP